MPRAIQTISKSISSYFRRERTRNELMRLTPRELADIGLTVGDIERVARGTA